MKYNGISRISLEPLDNKPLFKDWLRWLLRVGYALINCAEREMPKWQVERKLFGLIADLVKSANGFVLSDHEHEKSELINIIKNCEKSQVT